MEVFVARQPIFNRNQEVVAYELLYRSSKVNSFNATTDGDQATSEVLTNGLMLIGLDTLVGDKKAFINFTTNLLLDNVPKMFDKKAIVVEILENIEPSKEIINACLELKKAGYIIALDDFVFDPKFQPLIELADIIKVDFIISNEKERRDIVKNITNKKIKFLAEKVETNEEFQKAIQFGYTYFQGYFFSKPVIMSGQDIPSQKITYIQAIKEVNSPEPDFDKISRIIEKDVSISYKLLKYINYTGQILVSRIHSMKQALIILGLDEVKKWVSLIALRGIGQDKPDIIIRTSIIRAKMAEAIANKLGLQKRNAEYFMLGMFSMIDVLTNKPMEEILTAMPISDDIKKALLGDDSLMNKVYKLILAYEKGNWADFRSYASQIRLNTQDITKTYTQAISWVEQIYLIEKK